MSHTNAVLNKSHRWKINKAIHWMIQNKFSTPQLTIFTEFCNITHYHYLILHEQFYTISIAEFNIKDINEPFLIKELREALRCTWSSASGLDKLNQKKTWLIFCICLTTNIWMWSSRMIPTLSKWKWEPKKKSLALAFGITFYRPQGSGLTCYLYYNSSVLLHHKYPLLQTKDNRYLFLITALAGLPLCYHGFNFGVLLLRPSASVTSRLCRFA